MNLLFSRHSLALIGIVVLGAFLRFYQLDFKPLWLDEVITALFSFGRSYDQVPVEAIFSFDQLSQIFSLNAQTSCQQIADHLNTQSTHPPVFFCLMNQWMKALDPFPISWIWKLRSLPALLGVFSIIAVYFLNRIAFSPGVGLLGAGVMAVSPFGVYLAQEARHYTLPVFLITLSLIALIFLQKDLAAEKRPKFGIWVSWVVLNSLSFYVHYFCILAFISQLITLITLNIKTLKSWCLEFQSKNILLITIYLLPFTLFLPLLPLVFNHSGRSETGWIPHPHNIAPFYQTLAGWMTMVIMVPVEKQPIWITIPALLIMLSFTYFLGKQVYFGLKKLWNHPDTHQSTRTLLSFTLWVLLMFFVIVYCLGKDITVAPRYNFVYYPAMAALIGAGLSINARKTFLMLLLVGTFSCLIVSSDFAFKKPFHPQQVAQTIAEEAAKPQVMVIGYNDLQDIAMGLSFALAVEQKHPHLQNNYLAFLHRAPDYQSVWQSLSQQTVPDFPLNLWIVAPSLKRANYPQELLVSPQNFSCKIEPDKHYQVGIGYQLYRCE
jgi:uncharacterized membrane protein